MFLCFKAIERNGEQKMELCLLSAKPERINPPVRVDLLEPNEAAFYWIGYGEGVNVVYVPEERARIIRPILPAQIFITPSQPDQPGVKVNSLKVIKHGEREFEVHFSRDKSERWERWICNHERR